MKTGLKIFRAIGMTILALLLLIPFGLYIALSLPFVQETVRDIAVKELSTLLDTDVEIGSVGFVPFDKVTLRNVVIRDCEGDTAAYIRRLGAGIDLYSLTNERKKIKYAELIGLDARIYKESPETSLNIQSIIDALKPKDKSKPPTKFDLRINSIIIRDSRLAYNILSQPHTTDKFDKNHILISNFSADIHAPHIMNDDFSIDLKRFTLKEQSGLTLSNLTGQFDITANGSNIRNLCIAMPESQLCFDDIILSYNGWNDLTHYIKTQPFDIAINQGSYLTLGDLSGIMPKFKGLNARINTHIELSGHIDSLAIDKLSIYSKENNLHINCHGLISHITNKDSLAFNINNIGIMGHGNDIANLMATIGNISPKVHKAITQLGDISLNANASGNILRGSLTSNIASTPGNIDISTQYSRYTINSPINIKGTVSSETFNIGNIISNTLLGSVGLDTKIDATIGKRIRKGNIEGVIKHIDFKGYRYHDIMANVSMDNNFFDGSVNISDNNINLAIAGDAVIENSIPTFNLQVNANNIALDSLNLWNKYPGYRLDASIEAQYSGKTFDQASALLSINEFKLKPTDTSKDGLNINHIDIEVDNASETQHIDINSDLIGGRIEGSYTFATLVPTVKEILSHSFPLLASTHEEQPISNKSNQNNNYVSRTNNFKYTLTIYDNNELTDFIKAPIKLIHPIYIKGHVDEEHQTMALDVDAPYLQQGWKLIKETNIGLNINNSYDLCDFKATTIMPTKKGDATVSLNCAGHNNMLNTDISWTIDRQRLFKGNVSLSTLFNKTNDQMAVNVDINRSNLIFNDTIWTVSPAKINFDVTNKHVTVDGIDVRRDNQSITINGEASPDAEHRLTITLDNVNLDYIFETLAINNVTFGGNATGSFFASNLFTKQPVLYTPALDVKGLSYNGGIFGDAIIKSKWDNENGAVTINAEIDQPNGYHSSINGAIYPLKEALDLKFDANKINAQFMRPFMQAFAKDVTGQASGKAHLYGTFKLINMTGDIFAENLRLKIDFTNTYYTATDSIHIRHGHIAFDNVKLTDDYGNSGRLTGWLKHDYFRNAEFDFNIHDVNNMLCYDETEKRNPRWYGHIFGSGHASITGRPGYVGISVDMTTMPKSTFTFALLDSQEAGEYSFVTFRDRNKINQPKVNVDENSPIEKVKRLEAVIAERQKQQESKTQYLLDIHVNATREAEMTLIMDPAGGDRIKAHGEGGLQLTYDSRNEELSMNGTYRLEDGRYNFTLQDIIIKEFTIKKGSSITFNKDPFNADLNLTAHYTLNANLSDLDESFLQDKDLNRTNVPVNAVLKASGNMQQPDISFDLEFPTMSQDVYRKVKSIVSTDDMMNRQIIYLLALNRFYTPEYMASTTKGNELLSVATSTISSQLSSMLGELNDNINISPNIRSDKGDFSDLEVDLALSSSLLNNRLLFNGNFGYRDNSLNNNTFIGDFDIEYLLNKSGHIRLKAYNRYNDQNYYVKTALTTQGVGIVYRRDFDNIFSFMKPIKNWFTGNKKQEKVVNQSEKVDSIATDSIVTTPTTIIIGFEQNK